LCAAILDHADFLVVFRCRLLRALQPQFKQACLGLDLSQWPNREIPFAIYSRALQPQFKQACLGLDLSQWPNREIPFAIYSVERRWSSRRFPYGYLVTTSSQLPASP